MAFTPKDWRNATTHEGGGDETTPISAAAIEDLETRVTDYTDDRIEGLVINVQGAPYSAAGDGTTDDTAAIQAAINACGAAGGGIVYCPPGDYRLGTATLDVFGNPAALYIAYDNVHLVGAGRGATRIFLDVADGDALVFLVGGAVKAAVAATSAADHWKHQLWWDQGVGWTETPGWNLTGSIAANANAVTLATAADASNFAVGDYCAIRTGQTLAGYPGYQPDAEWNRVTSVNPTTGVVELETPTAKPYAQEYYITGTSGLTSTSVTANPAPYKLHRPGDRLMLNMRIANLALETDNGWVFQGGQIDGVEIADCDVLMTGGVSLWNCGTNRHMRVVRNTFTHRGALDSWLYCLAADTTCSDIWWLDNTVTTEKGTVYWHIHEGASRVVMKGNTNVKPVTTAASEYVVHVANRARDVEITDNIFSGGINAGGNTVIIGDTCPTGVLANNTYAGEGHLYPISAEGGTGWRIDEHLTPPTYTENSWLKAGADLAFGDPTSGGSFSIYLSAANLYYGLRNGITIKHIGTGNSVWVECASGDDAMEGFDGRLLAAGAWITVIAIPDSGTSGAGDFFIINQSPTGVTTS